MCRTFTLKNELHRLRKELGLLIRSARKREIFSAAETAKQNNLSDAAELYAFERGEHKNLLKYFLILDSYGFQVHLKMEYNEDNLNRKWYRTRANDSKHMFQLFWSGILRSQREFHHYSLQELSRLTEIPVKRLKNIEAGRAHFSLDEACLLMAYFNKELLPETVHAE